MSAGEVPGDQQGEHDRQGKLFVFASAAIEAQWNSKASIRSLRSTSSRTAIATIANLRKQQATYEHAQELLRGPFNRRNFRATYGRFKNDLSYRDKDEKATGNHVPSRFLTPEDALFSKADDATKEEGYSTAEEDEMLWAGLSEFIVGTEQAGDEGSPFFYFDKRQDVILAGRAHIDDINFSHYGPSPPMELSFDGKNQRDTQQKLTNRLDNLTILNIGDRSRAAYSDLYYDSQGSPSTEVQARGMAPRAFVNRGKHSSEPAKPRSVSSQLLLGHDEIEEFFADAAGVNRHHLPYGATKLRWTALKADVIQSLQLVTQVERNALVSYGKLPNVKFEELTKAGLRRALTQWRQGEESEPVNAEA